MRKVLQALEAMEARVTELEVKASYSDDLLEELNLIIYRQQQAMNRLTQDMQHLRQHLPDATGTTLMPRNLAEEVPPHY